MVSNNIFQSLWVGSDLSIMEQLCIKSFLANGHAFHLYVYDDVKNIPVGTTVIDGNEILDSSRIFRVQKGWGQGSLAGFSEIFRNHLLYKKGNWWVDTDVICLKPINIVEDIVIATSFEGPWGIQPNSNVLKFNAQDPFLHACVLESERTTPENYKYAQLGPHLVQRLVKEMHYEPSCVPFYFFNPIYWRLMDRHIFHKQSLKTKLKEALRPYLKPESMIGNQIQSESYTVHLWNEIWRTNNWDKNDKFHKDSLYEQLKKRYL